MESVQISYKLVSSELLPNYISKNPDILNNADFCDISIRVAIVIEGIASEKLMIKEEEVNGVLEGDFSDQFEKSTGHNSKKEATAYEDVVSGKETDVIGISILKNKKFSNGRARWDIPILLFHKDSFSAPIIKTVTQEYILENKKITILKGGSVLLDDYNVDT